MKKTGSFYARMIFVIVSLMILISLVSFNKQSCGIDRRLVKSLSDVGVKKISFVAMRVDVSDLVKLKHDTKIGDNTPRFGYEFNVYQLNCTIREYRKEKDGDYHLVLQQTDDASITMIGEILNPACDDLKNNPHLQEYIAVRTQFEKYILPNHKVKSGYYKLKGVCFFDRIHNQLGVAKNGVELHPILSFIKFK